MTWSRFDDLYDEHEKVEEAWFAFPPNPVGLHAMATTACNRWLSNGVIRPRWIEEKLPKKRDQERILSAMVTIELLDFLPAGETRTLIDSDENEIVVGPFDRPRYIVHDFLDRHDSSVQVKERREKDAARKRTGRRPESNGTPNGVRADSKRTPAGSRARPRVGAPPRPDPTLPYPLPPLPPEGGRKTDHAKFEKALNAFTAEHFPGVPPSFVASAAAGLRTRGKEPTVEALRGHVEKWATPASGAAA